MSAPSTIERTVEKAVRMGQESSDDEALSRHSRQESSANESNVGGGEKAASLRSQMEGPLAELRSREADLSRDLQEAMKSLEEVDEQRKHSEQTSSDGQDMQYSRQSLDNSVQLISNIARLQRELATVEEERRTLEKGVMDRALQQEEELHKSRKELERSQLEAAYHRQEAARLHHKLDTSTGEAMREASRRDNETYRFMEAARRQKGRSHTKEDTFDRVFQSFKAESTSAAHAAKVVGNARSAELVFRGTAELQLHEERLIRAIFGIWHRYLRSRGLSVAQRWVGKLDRNVPWQAWQQRLQELDTADLSRLIDPRSTAEDIRLFNEFCQRGGSLKDTKPTPLKPKM